MKEEIRYVLMSIMQLVIAELTVSGPDSRQAMTIDGHTVKTALGMMALFMIHAILTGDRFLSALGFIIFAGLAYLVLVQNKTNAPS
jgi:hypothetical protein